MQIVETHTAGEPTRVVVEGIPELQGKTLAEQRDEFRRKFDHLRSAIANEPRGSEVTVGALVLPPKDPHSLAGVIFFNNAGTLNMCGHGTMGVMAALAHLGRIRAGKHLLETPVGPVTCVWNGRNEFTLRNVPSYRFRKDVTIEVPHDGTVTGEIAWGGNWFFLAESPFGTPKLNQITQLVEFATRVRNALATQQVTGSKGAEIDHIELFGPPADSANHSRNFVLCPGGAYDRSPCGTGTSAKMACLVADGKLKTGEIYRQEGILGTLFTGLAETIHEGISPTLTGSAYVNAITSLIFNPDDPFSFGIGKVF